MRTYNFQLLIGKKNLKFFGRKYATNGLFIDVAYNIDRGGNVNVYHIGAGEAAHRQICWTDEVYNQIFEAAKNNYQSQFETNEKYRSTSLLNDSSSEAVRNGQDDKLRHAFIRKHTNSLQPLQSDC